ncbi:uncharacterized protein LOC130675282 isoform X1 [Microplitis mediator]|uniref:uncharacterized protein LOC130675282 isoform X1 n=1 Tax=Microplitis mediator TaxID=375433 RepID=UPI002554F7AC|nr:uncharacterized protein LOC130675282 isoform X1 [Microplitis mediator]
MIEHVNLNKLKLKLNYSKDKSAYNRYFSFIRFILWKITGLSPWKFESSGIFHESKINSSDKNDVCSVSYVGSCYNILVFLAIDSFAVYRLLDQSFNRNYPGPILSLIIVKFLFIALLCASLIPLMYIIWQKIIITVNNEFENVDEILGKCTDYEIKKSHLNNVIFIVNLFTKICLILVLDLFYYSTERVFYEIIPSIISSGVIIQYATQLNRVNKRFKSINLAILKLGDFKISASLTQVSSVTQTVLSRESIIYEIENIKCAYIKLCEMSENIADFYGIPILIAIFSFAVRSIFTVYFTILSLVKIQLENIVWYQNGIRILWIIFLFTVLTSSVTTITKQNKKLARIINSLTDRYTMDEKIKKNLAKFSNDLWHLKVELTACDIIPLDRTLLAIITGTIATYLVIGVQFALSTRSRT